MDASEAPVGNAGPPDLKPRTSYFGKNVTFKTYMPDGVQYVEHRKLLEGARKEYQNKTNKGVTIAQSSGDAKIELAPGDQRYLLLKTAIVGWNLFDDDGEAVPYSDAAKEMLLNVGLVDEAGEDLLDKVEADIRTNSPWLLDDVTVEKIDEQIERLTKLREKKVDQEGKALSSAA